MLNSLSVASDLNLLFYGVAEIDANTLNKPADITYGTAFTFRGPTKLGQIVISNTGYIKTRGWSYGTWSEWR